MAQNSWDRAYSEYINRLQSGEMDADFFRSLYGDLGGHSEKGNSFADRVIAIHEELEEQRKKFDIPYWGGKIGTSDAVWDNAFRLAETGTDSIYDLGQRTKGPAGIDPESGLPLPEETELYHKPTGAAVSYKTNSRPFDMVYNLDFSNGTPVPYTTNRQSSWMGFRENVLKPVVSIGASFIPGVGPFVAAANAAYAASKGDWERALLAGLSAAVPMAGKLGASAQTVGTLNTVRQAANTLKALESKDLLGLAMSGANMAGVTDVAGLDIKDVNRAVNMVKALQSENPAAIIQAGMGFMPKSGFSGPKSSDDWIEGYFLPGGEGYYDKDAENAKLSGPGYYDETTGRYIQDPLGGMQGPLDNTSGTRDPLSPWEYNQVRKDVWEDDKGNRIDLSYIPSSQKTQTGAEIMQSAGATAPKKPAGKGPEAGGPAKTPGTPGQNADFNQLMSLLGEQQAAPTIVTSGQDNSADVQLMEDIFGTSLSAPPAGDPVTQARELARLLRS